MHEESKDNKLFIKLIIGSILILIFLMTLIWILFFLDYIKIYKYIFLIIFTTISIGCIIIASLLIILFTKPYKKFHPIYIKWMKLSFKVFYPIVYMTGHLAHIDRDKIRGSFAYINNYIVGKENVRVKAKDVLLLLPHCIQWSDCPHKISNNINNCKMCGKCNVKKLIELANKYEIQISIVTGGTMARNIIKKKKPQAIVAVACERDLCSGISDVKVIPILGIINERPEGPCYNTKVDVLKVEKAILYFLSGEDAQCFGDTERCLY